MNSRKWPSLLAVGAVCLFFTGCGYDSKNPLSDPKTSKPDSRLAGVWRLQGEKGDVTYLHVGSAGSTREPGVMRVYYVTHTKNGELDTGRDNDNELLFFSTTLGSNTFLNVNKELLAPSKAAEPKAENPDARQGFYLVKYKVEGDSLLTWGTDYDLKKKAIADGKIKGLIEKQEQGPDHIEITDTTENLARFVTDDSDSLFSKKVWLRLERVK